jgi:hypothetical protein
MSQNSLRPIGQTQGTRRKAKAEQVGDKQLKAISQEWSQAPVFEKTAVETMQQQQRRALAEHRNREGIIDSQARQIPPLHLSSKGLGLRVKQSRPQLIQKRLQRLMGLSSAAPTRASSKAPGVTAKGK